MIMNDVVENGPAWESGVRAGDVIVTVNDWLIVLMDRPQVIWAVLRLMTISARDLFESCLFLSNFEIHSLNKTFLTFFLKLFLLSIELDLISRQGIPWAPPHTCTRITLCFLKSDLENCDKVLLSNQVQL